jgi:hypothetical protein
MKQMQSYMSLLTSFLLVSATIGLESCGAKETTPAPVVQAQSANTPAQDPSAQPAPAVPDAQSAQPDQQAAAPVQLPEVNLTADGLDELLMPVALYPDPVLAVLLQASVDPQQVMDGGNWLALDENQNLKEAALDQASSKAGFTPVMQALLHYPTVVDLLCQQFDWTKQLGAVYQGNPKAVLASVQRLRAQAVDTGALKSSPQMTVDVKQDQGAQVVELTSPDPKVVYVPQYDPTRVFSTTTTTTSPNGTTTTTTTSSAPATSSGSSTVVVQQQKSGVSTESAVLIGLLSFGAGIAVGMAINRNNYYYPAWGYGGVWYGPRPYYPPPYHPVYYPGWHGGGYHYNRPVHYGNTNIYINNNNYYNRFNNNNNLNPGYKPRPVPYNNNPNGVYAKSMGNGPNAKQGVNYRPTTSNNANNLQGQSNYQGNRAANNANANAKPATGNVQNRPGGANAGNNASTAQRPSTGNNANNWKGQSTYQGNKGGNTAGNTQARPSTTPGNASAGVNNRAGTGNAGGNTPGRPSTATGNANAGATNRMSTGNPSTRNPSSDRGYGQPGTTRPATTNTQGARPSTGNTNASRPASTPAQPAARPAQQPANRTQPTSGEALGGASNSKSDRAASNRGQSSMGAKPKSNGGGAQKR